ncbi:MAG: hypothetical protein QCH96_02245 [Candidatus Thermoplasmatota archaeon]|nr:hypothetical protein [Candidatus Thermoplasmatota archaeon]
MKINVLSVLIILMFFPTIIHASTSIDHIEHGRSAITMVDDLDPLVDLTVTFELLKIRSLEKKDNHLNVREYIDKYSYPDFYVKVWINDEMFKSPIWRNTRYVYDPDWKVTSNVPDDEEWVNITIQLWDWNLGRDQKCDISGYQQGGKDSYDVEIKYSLKTGHWMGDDYAEQYFLNADPSGYGRLNGCDDGSIYQHDFDAELWFDIYQNDFDGDGIPYWTEVNVFGTDPTIDDRGRDDDGDGVPIEWEWKWGHSFSWDYQIFDYQHIWRYDPFIWEDHKNLDPDNDGLSNYEEYLTWQWGSDPFRKDLFVEMDQMAPGPNGETTDFPEESKELLRTAYGRQNIVFHLDDGCMGGGERIPFDDSATDDEIRNIYWNYFLHQDEDNWRCGVFHYGLVIYNAERYPGFGFWGGVKPVIDSYQISALGMEKKARYPYLTRDIVYASAYMHECGHTLGIFHGNTPGCDDQEGKYPWQLNYWRWRPYKSVMNYGYMYQMVDYSDGSRGKNDFNDWNRIDLTFFKTPLW